jgi:predicted Rossmann-fold nucleotide-binding protein
MLRKLPIVGVFGQGTPVSAERARLAREVGAMVARLGAHLLTGAGFGIMAAAAEGFVAVEGRAGLSIGIVPCAPGGPLYEPNRAADGRSYPNAFVEIVIRTPLPPRVENWQEMPARNHINVLSTDAIVALPGGPGTRNELDMAAFYHAVVQHPRAGSRVVLLGPAGEFAPTHRDRFVHATTFAEAERLLADVLASRGIAMAET